MNRRNLLISTTTIGVTGISGCIGDLISQSPEKASDPWKNIESSGSSVGNLEVSMGLELPVGQFATKSISVSEISQFEYDLNITSGNPVSTYLYYGSDISEEEFVEGFSHSGSLNGHGTRIRKSTEYLSTREYLFIVTNLEDDGGGEGIARGTLEYVLDTQVNP